MSDRSESLIAPRVEPKMDVLSEVLKVVRLEGAIFFNAEFTAPWCLKSPSGPAIAPYLSAEGGHSITFHFLTEGRAFAKLANGQSAELTAGDIVVFPHGDMNFLGNGWPVKPVDSLKTFAKSLSGELKLVRFGGGGEVTRFVCGFLACDKRLSDVFLAGLPAIFKVHVTNEPSGEWLAHSIRFSVDERREPYAGSGLVQAKLSELLFVETLRRYISELPADQTGWLAGARDPVVGRALALLHGEVAVQWTIASLAKRVGSSRTQLAERFRSFLHESPFAYLTRWRMKLAAERLQSPEGSVAEIAASVGYGSEASFNRAFKREYKVPPAQFRRSHKKTEVS